MPLFCRCQSYIQLMVFTFVVLLGSTSFAQTLKCSKAYNFKEIDSVVLEGTAREFLERLLSPKNIDTTSLRKEIKIVVHENQFSQYWQQLQKQMQGKIESRDMPQAGHQFWTETVYTSPFTYNYFGKEKSMKIRFRRYIDENLSSGEMQPLAITRDQKMVEVKIEHPEFDNVVVKHRIRMNNQNLQQLLTKGQFSLKEIEQDPMNKSIVESGMHFDMLHLLTIAQKDKLIKDTDYVVVRYQRFAYRITLHSKNGEPIDVQITVDQNVELRNPGSNHVIASYPTPARAVEVKLPLQFSGLTAKDLNEVPELRFIKEFISNLSKNHLKGFEIYGGKFGQLIERVKDAVSD